MNDTTNLRLGIAQVAEAVLGDNLLGLQLGNEPDLYAGYVSSVPPIRPTVPNRFTVMNQTWSSAVDVLSI